MSRTDLEAILELLEQGAVAEERLQRMQGALQYLIEGCSYPRAIRHRLREIAAGTWAPPAQIASSPRKPSHRIRAIGALSPQGET